MSLNSKSDAKGTLNTYVQLLLELTGGKQK